MRAVPLLVLALALAAPLASGTDPGTIRVLDWRLPGCAMVVANVDVEPARAREILPPGFEPAVWGPLGKAKFLVEFAQCGEVEYGNWEAIVVPGDEHARDDVFGYYVKFDTLVQNDSTRERLVAWGLPVHDGTASVEPTPVPDTYRAQMRMDDVGAFALDFTLTGEAPPPEDFPFLEFTPLGGGALATWDVALRDLALAQGAGLLTLPPESRLADLAGADRLPVEVWAGEWSAFEGTVATPAGELPIAIGGAAASPLVVAAAVAGGAAGAGALWQLARWIAAASAYARITRRGAAAHPRRQAILALVRERPGVTPAEIRRELRYAPGVVSHHLQLLERHGYVERARAGATTHLFLAGARTPLPLPAGRARLLRAIEARPGATQQELARALRVSRWTVAFHARALERDALVIVERDGRIRRHRAARTQPNVDAADAHRRTQPPTR